MVKVVKPVFSKTKIFYGMKQVTQIAFPLRKGKSVYTIKDIQELAKNSCQNIQGKVIRL